PAAPGMLAAGDVAVIAATRRTGEGWQAAQQISPAGTPSVLNQARATRDGRLVATYQYWRAPGPGSMPFPDTTINTFDPATGQWSISAPFGGTTVAGAPVLTPFENGGDAVTFMTTPDFSNLQIGISRRAAGATDWPAADAFPIPLETS